MGIYTRRTRLHMGLVLTIGVMVLGWSGSSKADSQRETADLLITLFRVGHTVVSDQQNLINDPSKGFKGFTPEAFGAKVIEQFRQVTQLNLAQPQGIPNPQLLLALLESEKEVIDQAQITINFKGVAFKGFVAALFARRTADRFYAKTGIRFKLTAPDYRFAGNKPDDFEAEVLRFFSDPRHPKGQPYRKTTVLEGKPVLRILDPEYATSSCLYCHGTPKGERDITGGKKEGQKEGDLAGAISLMMPLR